MRALIFFLAITPLLTVAQTSTGSTSTPTITSTHKPNTHSNAAETIDLSTATEQFNDQCMQSTGKQGFCSCIKLLSVFGLDFASYNTIASASPGDLELARKLASKELSETYDAVLLRHKQCTENQSQ